MNEYRVVLYFSWGRSSSTSLLLESLQFLGGQKAQLPSEDK